MVVLVRLQMLRQMVLLVQIVELLEAQVFLVQ
jgi:hypothetical protein